MPLRWPWAFDPQHMIEALLRIPQVSVCPASTATPMNRPDGGMDSPEELLPQQSSPPAAVMAQLFDWPEASATCTPAGTGLTCALLFSPQQRIEPVTRIAQLWTEPASRLVNIPLGAAVWPKLLRPQQTIPLPVRSAHA